MSGRILLFTGALCFFISTGVRVSAITVDLTLAPLIPFAIALGATTWSLITQRKFTPKIDRRVMFDSLEK